MKLDNREGEIGSEVPDELNCRNKFQLLLYEALVLVVNAADKSWQACEVK